MSTDGLVAAAWEAEGALLTPAVRGDRARLESLLGPDFTEIGQSGRLWTRGEIVTELVGDSAPLPPAVLTERAAQLVGRDTVLLTYRLELDGAVSRRSSLWRRDDDGVRCMFHQGTPVPS
ncbi:nuclear transport factor 2 family protein [Georgenia sp. Marseille-Q6866]